MGVQQPNSTNYQHPNEPNLLDLVNAMDYNNTGQPVLRAHVDGITLQGDVIVDKVRLWDGTSTLYFEQPSNDGELGQYSLPAESYNMVFNGTTWDRMRGNTTDGTLVKLTNDSIAVTGTFWQATQPVSGTVELGSTTLAALETINANVSGTVTIQDGGGSITVDGTVNANVTFPSIYPVSKDTNPNTTTNRLYVSMETDAVVADSNYFFNVGRGLVDGQYLEFKNGYCVSMSSSTTGYTVWNEGTLYPWTSWTTAQQLFIYSSSASDTGQTIWVNGLDANYNKISETVTTAGTGGVTTVNSYLRINNVVIVAGDTNVGTIRTRLDNVSGAIVGSMYIGMGRNKQAVFTVPAGYTAYIVYGNISSYKNGTGNVSGQVDMRVRPFGATWINAYAGIAANGQYSRDFIVPFAVTEKSDIDVRFAASGNGTTVACDWEMILIPN